MGQQQILFVILAVCIIAITLSIGIISSTGNSISDDRVLLADDLKLIAAKAQDYAKLPVDQRFGASFFPLSRLPDALAHLGCPSSNSHGDFFIKKSIDPSRLQIVAVGIRPGYNQTRPMCLMITVWSDSTSLRVLN